VAFEKKLKPEDNNFVDASIAKAAAELKKGTASITEAVAAIEGLGEKVDNLALEIKAKEDRNALLDVEFENKQRQLNIDLDLNVKENTSKVVDAYLAEIKHTSVPTDTYNKLNNDLKKLQNEYNNEVAAEVNKAGVAARHEWEQEKRLLDAQHNQKEAQNIAKIDGLTFQNTQLQLQVEMLVKQLDAERAAGVQRAQANVAPIVNVGGVK